MRSRCAAVGALPSEREPAARATSPAPTDAHLTSPPVGAAGPMQSSATHGDGAHSNISYANPEAARGARRRTRPPPRPMSRRPEGSWLRALAAAAPEVNVETRAALVVGGAARTARSGERRAATSEALRHKRKKRALPPPLAPPTEEASSSSARSSSFPRYAISRPARAGSVPRSPAPSAASRSAAGAAALAALPRPRVAIVRSAAGEPSVATAVGGATNRAGERSSRRRAYAPVSRWTESRASWPR